MGGDRDEIIRKLQLIVRKLAREQDDIRHALLDVSPLFLDLAELHADLPAAFQRELRELRIALREVQPRFASHRRSSVLFDQAGMGMHGKKQAADLTRRIVVISRSIEKHLEQ